MLLVDDAASVNVISLMQVLLYYSETNGVGVPYLVQWCSGRV